MQTERENSSRQVNGQQSKKSLNKFCRDLNKLFREGKLAECIGRETEIKRVETILSKEKKRNAVLVGDPGVGKTAIAEGLAAKIERGEVPDSLLNKRIFELRPNDIIAGASMRGEAEERIKSVLDEASEAKDEVIIFIDEVHTVLSSNGAGGGLDIANILKPYLARGEFMCIGSTTYKEYQSVFEKDHALSRRFQKVNVEEPSEADTKRILMGTKAKTETHHKVFIPEEILDKIISLSVRYLSHRRLPDKAIDLLDESCALVKTFPDENRAAINGNDLEKLKDEAIRNGNFELAAQYHRQMKRISKGSDINDVQSLTMKPVLKVLSLWTGVPIELLTKSLAEKIEELERDLNKNLIGQLNAKTAIVKSLKRQSLGLRDRNRPLYSAIALGPTGVGKTECTKIVARNLIGSEEAIIRIDMSEYQEEHTVARLIGSPPGYVGHDEGGQLVNAIRKRPFAVVLFDEIEKAHPRVFDIFLQILEEGELTDGQGNKADFRNTYIFMTSNLPVGRGNSRVAGFNNTEIVNHRDDLDLRKQLSKHLRPEIVNRIDEVLRFEELTNRDVHSIVVLNLQRISVQLSEERGIKINYTEEVVNYLTRLGYSPEFGAREIKRVIQREIVDRIAEEVSSTDQEDKPEFNFNIIDGVLNLHKTRIMDHVQNN